MHRPNVHYRHIDVQNIRTQVTSLPSFSVRLFTAANVVVSAQKE